MVRCRLAGSGMARGAGGKSQRVFFAENFGVFCCELRRGELD